MLKPYIIKRLVKLGLPASDATLAVRERRPEAKHALQEELKERCGDGEGEDTPGDGKAHPGDGPRETDAAPADGRAPQGREVAQAAAGASGKRAARLWSLTATGSEKRFQPV